MKKLLSGRHKTQLRVHSLTLNDLYGNFLHNQVPFWLDVEFYYEPELSFTEDEPGCPEYVEIISLNLAEDVEFSTEGNPEVIVATGNLIDYISGKQYDDFVTMLIMQSKGDCDGA